MPNNIQGSNILVVDDVPENLRLLTAILKRGGLIPRPVNCGKLAIEAAVADRPDLVLLDVRMPEMSGMDVCRWFKQDERLQNIPIVFISGLQGIDDKVDAFAAGAVDYVSKPFQEQEVLARIKTHLQLSRLQVTLATHNVELEQRVAEQVKAVTATQLATIFALAKLSEARDYETGQHVERVQIFSKMLAKQMQTLNFHAEQITDAFVETIFQSASLHDIGKVGTPDAILLKPGKLTDEEFAKMQQHSTLGATTLTELLKRHPENPFLRMGFDVTKSHHEKWNGSGYPDKLKGQDIPLAARIVALADFYDAVTSNRCYRQAYTQQETHKLVQEGSGTHFDPDVVTAFVGIADEFWRVRLQMQNT